jgi:hypothetical protein
MNKKPITPKMHGLIDYGFAAIQLLAPELLGLNKKAKKVYAFFGTNLIAYNALTDHPVAVKPEISYETHHKIDVANVAILAASTLYDGIRKDKRAVAFHLGFVVLAAINVLLTDWKADSHVPQNS